MEGRKERSREMEKKETKGRERVSWKARIEKKKGGGREKRSDPKGAQ